MCTRLQYSLDHGGVFAKSGKTGLSQMVSKLHEIHTIFCTQILDLEVITAVMLQYFLQVCCAPDYEMSFFLLISYALHH